MLADPRNVKGVQSPVSDQVTSVEARIGNWNSRAQRKKTSSPRIRPPLRWARYDQS
jgi:hypothetical protein